MAVNDTSEAFSEAVTNEAWISLDPTADGPGNFQDINRYHPPKMTQIIKFRTPSDAILADLLIREKVDHSTLDILLKVLRLPSFKQDEVTLRESTDFDEYIAQQRREQQIQRSTRFSSDFVPAAACTGPGCVPIIVVDLVSEFLKDLVLGHALQLHFHTNREVHRDSYADEIRMTEELHTSEEIFKTMSLIHRTWTPYAQNALRVVFSGAERFNFGELLQSPFAGFTTRMIVSGDFKESNKSEDYYDKEIQYFMNSLFKRFTGLQALLLGDIADKLNTFSIEGLVVPPLRFLELNNMLTARRNNELLVAISQMRYLEKLCLPLQFQSTFQKELIKSIPPSLASPPSTLKILGISQIIPTAYSLEVLQWLCMPVGYYSLTSVSISVNNYSFDLEENKYDVTPITPVIVPCLPHIEFLYFAGNECDYETEFDLWMSKCQKLRYLALGSKFKPPFTFSPPRSLRTLDIRGHYITDSQCFRMVEIVLERSIGELRNLVVKSLGETTATNFGRAKVEELCRKHGVEIIEHNSDFEH